MARWPMLILRGSTWYYRRSIPLALRPLMDGKKELWRSLRTDSKDEARLLSLKVGAEVERHFQALRKNAHIAVTKRSAPFLALSEDVLTTLHDDGTRETAELNAEIRDMEIALLRKASVVEPVKSQRSTVGDVLTAYLTERKLPSKSEAEFKACWRRFSDLVGSTTPASEVTKAQCREFKAALLSSGLSAGTTKKLLGIVATIWRHAVGQGLVDVNIWDGITRVVRTSRLEEGRLPFTDESVRTFFEHMHELSPTAQHVSRILFYSAMRLSEAGNLRGSHIQQREGVYGFSIEPTKDTSVKTKTSVRFVPMHSKLTYLIPLAEKAGDGFLFADLAPDVHGNRTTSLSKTFARYLRKLKLDEGGRVVMHSARGAGARGGISSGS